MICLKMGDVALSALFAAIYAVSVTLLAPISFHIYQVRISDILMPLSIIFGMPAVLGLTLGAFIGNLSGPFGPVDWVGGALANLLGSYAAWKIGSRSFKGSWILGIFAENLVVTFMVGSYLALLLGIPLQMGWLLIFIGSFIAMNGGGYLLLKAVDHAVKAAPKRPPRL